MITVAHFVFGLALAYLLDRRLVTASAFAIVPDFDITLDFLYPFTHRGIMHTLLAAVVFSGLVYVYTEDRVSAESCLLGYTSHFALDLLTPSGIPLLFPFMSDFALSLTSAYSLKVNSAIIAASLTAMYVKKSTQLFKKVKTRSKTFPAIQALSINLNKGCRKRVALGGRSIRGLKEWTKSETQS
ncbi:MAG: metal-dependent hydrolase [Candidatus Nanohaloarchaea archaeon]